MDKPVQVARVVVVPMSGYVNRLQAIASSAIVADRFNAELLVCWTDVNVTPAPAAEVFSPDFVEQHVIEPKTFRDVTGMMPAEVATYLTVSGDVVTLAGSDKGEQVFMPRLQAVLEQSPQPVTLVFSAGGNFSFSDPETAITERGDWYRRFTLSNVVESRVEEILNDRSSFIGVHLRYTDRSHEAPLEKEIHRAIFRQVELLSTDSVFIASDTIKARDKLCKKLEMAGLKPWSAEVVLDKVDRNEAAVGALVDWKVLGHAQSSVFFAASSFGHEAAVMAGSLGTSIALPGHAIQRFRSRAKELSGNLVNYPRNHWFN